VRDPGDDIPAARRSRGMSLIEVMIVMGIFVLMMGMVIVGFRSSRSAEALRAVNQVSNAVRYGFDKARVSGASYRLLINLDQGTFTLQEGDGRMYMPATDRDGQLVEYDADKAKDREDRDQRAEESYNRSLQAQVFGGAGDKADDATVNPYAATARKVPRMRPPMFAGFKEENALSGLSEAIALPEGVKISYVRTEHDFAPITEGEASLFFFPRGHTQRAHILVEDADGENRWTIKVAPLTGRVTVDEGHELLELPSDPGEEEDDLGRRQERRVL